MRLRLLMLALAAVMFAPKPVYADEFDGKKDLSVDDKANIDADRQEAHKAIDEKYKDDDSPDARRAKMDEYNAADDKVLENHGISREDYAAQERHGTQDDANAERDRTKEVVEQRKKDKEAAEKAKSDAANAGPEVIKGFDDQHPLDMSVDADKKPAEKPKLDADGNPIPTVEKLNPADDPNAGQMPPEEAPQAPSKHHRGKKSRSAGY